MMLNSVFQIKRDGENYVVWASELGVLVTDADLDVAMDNAEAKALDIIQSFTDAGVAVPTPSGNANTSMPISSLIKANMISFAMKSVVVGAVLVVVMMVASRMLPMRGMSDFADYARLAPQERIDGLVGAAKDIGEVSRPVLNALGLG